MSNAVVVQSLRAQLQIVGQKLEMLNEQRRAERVRLRKAAGELEWLEWKVAELEEQRASILCAYESMAPFEAMKEYPVNETFDEAAEINKEQAREAKRLQRRLHRERDDTEAARVLRGILEEEGLDGTALMQPRTGRPSKAQREQRARLAVVFQRAKDAGLTHTQLAKLSNRSVAVVSEMLAEGDSGETRKTRKRLAG